MSKGCSSCFVTIFEARPKVLKGVWNATFEFSLVQLPALTAGSTPTPQKCLADFRWTADWSACALIQDDEDREGELTGDTNVQVARTTAVTCCEDRCEVVMDGPTCEATQPNLQCPSSFYGDCHCAWTHLGSVSPIALAFEMHGAVLTKVFPQATPPFCASPSSKTSRSRRRVVEGAEAL
eukprot:3933110-Rhodomonas_salina.1